MNNYPQRRKTPVIDRVVKHLDMTGDCWVWTGATLPNGYGLVGNGRTREEGSRNSYVHRAVYEAVVGPIPDGLTIDHLCFTRACVNPDHLEVVTRSENISRAQSRNRLSEA
jgi:hypothetical protein